MLGKKPFPENSEDVDRVTCWKSIVAVEIQFKRARIFNLKKYISKLFWITF